jgi:hypothetical protein
MLLSEPTPTLRSLVGEVDVALWSRGEADTVLLRVVEPGELAIRPLDGAHPLDVLLGFVAPAEWAALGVAAPGTGHALDGDQPPERVHVTMLIARSSASAGVLRRGDRVTPLGDPPQGLVADACRRALGLPTAPPPATTAGLWVRWWLDALVQAAAERGPGEPALGWLDAVALHPATFVPEPGEPLPEPAAVAAATLGMAEAWGWGRLRGRPQAGDLSPGSAPGGLTREVASWMDDGMYARWLLAGLPPPDDLLDACWGLLPEAVAAQVAATVAVATAQSGPEPEKAVAR